MDNLDSEPTVEVLQLPPQMPKICYKCKEAITQNVTTALGRDWHPEHFCCNICNAVINESPVRIRNEEPICNDCFMKDQPQCARCSQPILNTAVKALKQMWHPECFTCAGPCGKPIEKGLYSVHEGKPYCNVDYDELFCEKCAGCKKALLKGSATRAFEGLWHRECFKCSKCAQVIADENFVETEGQAVCYECNLKVRDQ